MTTTALHCLRWMREAPASQYAHTTYGVSVGTQGEAGEVIVKWDMETMQQANYWLNVADVPAVHRRERREKAIAWLRDRGRYCLDVKQPRIPPQERKLTVLDKWMKERHK